MASWTKSVDGISRITIRVEHRLSLEDIAAILAERFPYRDAADGYPARAIAGRTRAELVAAVREVLASQGEGSDGDEMAPTQDFHRAAAVRAFGMLDADDL